MGNSLGQDTIHIYNLIRIIPISIELLLYYGGLVMNRYAAKRTIVIIIAFIIVQLTGIHQVLSTGDSMWYYPPTPQGTVGIDKPTIMWTFVGLSSKDIREVNMLLDSQRVDAVFSDDYNSVYYTPPQGLAEGQHNVSIVVALKNGIRISSSPFSFTIVKDAYQRIPEYPQYHEAKDRINYYRMMLGLDPVEINESLNAAAATHAQYLIENMSDGHYQNNKKSKYYIGHLPWNRTTYYGYASPMMAENIHFVDSHLFAVDDWMDSLYHRFPIINPIYLDMGYGYANKGDRHVNVLNIGAPRYGNTEQRIVVYPFDSQRGVPLTWSGLEEPNPFRLYPDAEGPGGYPITLMVSGDHVDRVDLKSADLTDDQGQPVDYYSFNSQNDSSMVDKMAVAVIPKDKLKPNTVYNVIIKGIIHYNDGSSNEFSHEWSFTTGKGGLESYDRDAKLKVYIEGRKVEYDPEPFIKDDRVLVPVRYICEELGAVVRWDPNNYSVEIIKESNIVVFSIGSNEALVNNRKVKVDVPPELWKDRTFVPIRFVSEILGYRVEWDGIMRVVLVYNK
jgi:uncharacterized protein YkwD